MDLNARILNYDLVLDIREQCRGKKIKFSFRQCGINFIKEGRLYHLKSKDLMALAKKANIDLY